MNLLQFLSKNEEARKIFGKRELKIIEKQLNGLNLSQSEKNRLSRDIRKKLSFIQDISKFKEEFGLKKGREIKRKISEAKEEILNHKLRHKIKMIYLFGSAVKNEMTFRSDIDIAVEFKDIAKKEAFDFRKKILGNVSNKVDIQVFNFLPEKMQKSIKKNHRILYEK